MTQVTSINPQPNEAPQNVERVKSGDRRTVGLEIIQNETIANALKLGATKYGSRLKQSYDEAKENGEVGDTKRPFDNIRVLGMILDSGAEQRESLQKRADKMRTTVWGSKEAYVIVGQDIPANGTIVRQLEIRAIYPNTGSVSEQALTQSYEGKSAERVYLGANNSRVSPNAPINFSVMVKDVSYDKNASGIVVHDTTGIALNLDRNGNIIEARGMTYKLGEAHYTEGLLADEDLSDLGNASDVIPMIQEFVQ